jgi:site-specific recombinase XerD
MILAIQKCTELKDNQQDVARCLRWIIKNAKMNPKILGFAIDMLALINNCEYTPIKLTQKFSLNDLWNKKLSELKDYYEYLIYKFETGHNATQMLDMVNYNDNSPQNIQLTNILLQIISTNMLELNDCDTEDWQQKIHPDNLF